MPRFGKRKVIFPESCHEGGGTRSYAHDERARKKITKRSEKNRNLIAQVKIPISNMRTYSTQRCEMRIRPPPHASQTRSETCCWGGRRDGFFRYNYCSLRNGPGRLKNRFPRTFELRKSAYRVLGLFPLSPRLPRQTHLVLHQVSDLQISLFEFIFSSSFVLAK